jgi:hypothetical protein
MVNLLVKFCVNRITVSFGIMNRMGIFVHKEAV